MPAEKPKSDSTSDKSPAKVFDVAKPGESTPSNTSRPIIVGHAQSMKRDPMMAEEAPKPSDDKAAEDKTPAQKSPSMTIEPPKHNEEEKAVVDEPKAPKAEKEAESSQSSDEAVVDALAGDISTKQQHEKELEAQAKHNQEIEKIIQSKKYFVRTKTAAAKRNRQWFVLLIVVVLAAAAWYLLLGPGKDLWAKSNTLPVAQPVIPTSSDSKPKLTTVNFNDKELGFSIKHLSNWEATAKPPSRNSAEYAVIILGPEVSLNANTGTSEKKQVKVSPRVRISKYPGTTPISKKDAQRVRYKSCKTEQILINGKSYNLATIGGFNNPEPQEQVLVTDDNCIANTDGSYSVIKFAQFTNPNIAYIVKIDYRVTDSEFVKNGGDLSNINLEVLNNASLLEESFFSESQKQMLDILKSLKPL